MRKYDSYKDSGVEWLGEVPEHWEISRLKNLGRAIIGLTYSPDDIVDESDGILVLRSSNIQNDKVCFKDNVYVKKVPKKSLITKKGDILICSRNGSRALIGKNIRIDDETKDLTFGAFMTIYRSKCFMYLSYFFNSQLFDYQSGAFMTSTINQLTINTLNQLITLNPPLYEQNAIAQYLDTKTQAIDKKVNLLEKKIGYYKELRKSIINETVTKGLDKSVKLKDSGIDWIGQIPEHWELKRLKDKLKFSKGKNANMYNQDYVKDLKNQGTYPVYSGQTENDGLMAEINTYVYSFDKTVLLVSTVGAKAMEVKAISGKFTLSQNCALIETLKANDNCDFYFYYLIELFREERKIIPTIMQPSLRIEDLVKYNLILPPLSEQTEIATYLDHKTLTIDKIVGNIQNQITTLKELRKTLINDVVTGKVKVVE